MKYLTLLSLACFLLFACKNNSKSSTSSNSEQEQTESVQQKATTQVDSATPDSSDENKLQGIDISEYQTNIDWSEVRDDQISFVFIKATGGETYVDPSFEKHYTDAGNAGIIKGPYHFYYTKDDPTTQANFFISTIKPNYSAEDLPPVLDIETAGVNTDITIQQLQDDIKRFLSTVENSLGRKPILYTSHAFAQKYFDNPDFSEYYLWLAEYDTESPRTPNGWESTGWTFWQNNPNASVSGIDGPVDHDIFKGDMEALKSL